MKSDRAVVTMRNSPALQGRVADAVGRVLGERGYDDAGGGGPLGRMQCVERRRAGAVQGGWADIATGGGRRAVRREQKGGRIVECPGGEGVR